VITEKTDPLPVLLFRLRETRRSRRRWFIWGGVVGYFFLFLSYGLTGYGTAAEALVLLCAFVLGPILLIVGNVRYNKRIRGLREQIAWAEAALPPDAASASPKTDRAAWLTLAGAIAAPIGTVLVEVFKS
jgi:drug/metabolite transporter (DMT)-like permease